MADRPDMIVARGLTKRFGKRLVVDALNFAIPSGRVVGFLGPNGAGKSTIIRMIAGFHTPSAGTVEVAGFDVTRHPQAAQARLGYLPESAPSYTEMRVGEFLKFRAKMFGVERAKRKRNIDLAVKRCWLEEVVKRPIGQLSKGFRQRVGLAAALVHQPPVLILDEPTVGLDPTQILEFRGLLRELASTHTILLSTHILPEVEVTCDQIIMIARGRIRAQGTLAELTTAIDRENRYVIETDAPKAVQVVREMKGVREVDSQSIDGAWRRLTIRPNPNAGDLRESLAAAMTQANCSFRELHQQKPSLEHMFIQMIAEAEVDAPPSATPSRGVAA